MIVDRAAYALLAAEILFSCLHRDMPEEKLDLIELTTRSVAKARAGTTKIVGRQFLDSGLFGAGFDDVPDNPLRHAVTPGFSRTADAPEQAAIGYFSRSQPRINSGLDPLGYRHGANMSAFADSVHDGPVVLAPLKVQQIKLSGFPAAQPTTQQNRD